jgi:hypothetical protein
MQTKKTSSKTSSGKEETFEVKGEDLLKKIKGLINEGNVRRIIIKDKEGKTIMELPLTIGVVGAVLAPVLSVVGAVAALVTECSITVERK